MARALRRTPTPSVIEPQTDPFEEAVIIDNEGIAGDLGEILDKLSGYDSSSIKGVLFQKPKNGVGRFEWIEEVSPPFDMSGIMQELKERFGGGDFRLSIFAGGKVRKQIEFSIVREKTALIAPQKTGDDNMMLFMQMMMNSQQEAARESRAAADRQMQMMMQMQTQSSENARNSMTAIVTMMTAGMGNQPKVTDLIPLMAANKGEGGLKEMVETLAVLKGLTEAPKEAGAFDPENIAGSLLKIAGPVAGAIGRGVAGMRGQTQGGQPQVAPQSMPGTMPGQDYDPAQLALPMTENPAPQVALPAPVDGTARLLNLIRQDVNYFFLRQHEPELAAQAVYAVIEAGLEQGLISEDDINDMVSAFMVSPNWIADLAGAGIDLRARPEWAQQFLGALVTEHTNAFEGDDDIGGQDGSDTDLGANGQAFPPGLQVNEGATTGGNADDAGI